MSRSWLLTGLNGSNPLAFLAALGMLRTATLMWPNSRCRMAWKRSAGNWRPAFTVEAEDDADLVAALAKELEREPEHQAFAFSNNLTVEPLHFEFDKKIEVGVRVGTPRAREPNKVYLPWTHGNA